MNDPGEEKRRSGKESAAFIKDSGDFALILDILRGVFGALGLFEGDDPFEFPGAITLEDVVSHPVFARETHDFYKNMPLGAEAKGSHGARGEAYSAYDTPGLDILSHGTTVEAAVRATLSMSIERYTEQSMARGVSYKMGAKGEGNSVDCSGFVANVIKRMTSSNPDFSGENLSSAFANHSDGQVASLSRMTGFMLKGQNVNMDTLKAGMVIGIDSGDKKWDRGRTHGIDHVGIVYMDTETRQLMFAESRSKKGVTATHLDEWMDKAQAKGYRLYASDVAKLASEDYKMQVEDKIRLAATEETKTGPGPESQVSSIPAGSVPLSSPVKLS